MKAVEDWLGSDQAVADIGVATSRPAPAQTPTSDDLTDIERRLALISGRWAAGNVSDDEYDAARTVLVKRRAAAEKALLTAPDVAAPRYDRQALLTAWESGLTMAERRDMVSEVVQCPIVIEAARGRTMAGRAVIKTA